MKMLKGSFARKLNKINGGEKKFWQKRFYDERILDTLTLIKKLEYIHNNPMKAGLVNSPEEYSYSSYNYYIKSGNLANPIIEIDKPTI